MSSLILAISYFFHLIATIIWLGGLFVLVWWAFPESRRSPAVNALIDPMRKRFLPLTQFSLMLLLVTGMVQMSGDSNYDGLLQITSDWSRAILLKHVAIAGMFICGLAIQYSVYPALERARLLAERGKGVPGEEDRLRRREIRLTWINVVLAVGVLACTAWATAL